MMRATTLALGFVWLVPALAAAQQPAAPPPPPPPPREITAEASYVGVTGNSDTQTLGLGGGVILRTDPWEYTGKVAYVRSEDAGVLDAETLAGSFRAARSLTTRLAAFGEYLYLRDEFSGIEHRNTINGGLSYLLINDVRHQLKVLGGLGFANEQRIPEPDLSAAVIPLGMIYTFRISETSNFTNDFRLTQSLDEGEDRWVVNIAALTAKLNALLSLKVSNTVRWANRPVIGREGTDTTTAVALVATFH